MVIAFIVLCVVSLLFLAMAVAVLLGKGDHLIVGYNLTSRESRERYHTRRVRAVAGCILIIVAATLPACGLMLGKGHVGAVMTLFPPAIFAIVAATFTLIHLWARKR